MMLDLALNPAVVEAVVANVEIYTIGLLERILQKYPGAVDLIGCGDDYGTQQSLLISREMIDRYFMPSLRRHYDLGKKYGAAGYHHCCGAIFEIIPSMIEAGVKVLNPIQTSAEGMDPAGLKKSFGKELCFHGGIDIQQTLVYGTPDEVRAEVRSRIETLGPEGYILSPSHTLQVDTPPANVVAMYEEARDYGRRICDV
jgi:uroporphyrinogen decarboxylase